MYALLPFWIELKPSWCIALTAYCQSRPESCAPCISVIKALNLSIFRSETAFHCSPDPLRLGRHVNTDSSSDGGGGGSTDARHTNSMQTYNSTDMAGNSHRDSTHSTHPGIQTPFQPKP